MRQVLCIKGKAPVNDITEAKKKMKVNHNLLFMLLKLCIFLQLIIKQQTHLIKYNL